MNIATRTVCAPRNTTRGDARTLASPRYRVARSLGLITRGGREESGEQMLSAMLRIPYFDGSGSCLRSHLELRELRAQALGSQSCLELRRLLAELHLELLRPLPRSS